MSENIQNAIQSALNSKSIDFKFNILSALQDKVQDVLHLKKIELGSKLLSDPEELESDVNVDISDNEENVDENL